MARLSAQEEKALQAFVRDVRACLGQRVSSITLFGSRARGEGRDDSDLDVLVKVIELTRDDRRIVQDLAFDVGFEHRLVLSPLLADALRWRADLPLGRAIEREGRAL